MIKSRKMTWIDHVARIGEKRNADMVLGGRLEGKRSQGRHIRRWEDNIKMDIREIRWGIMLWNNLAEGREVKGSCEHGNEISVSIKCWEILE
jgi:hypothetical protein